uniref:mRNA splicing factor PRP17 n=1 Tax=Lotharella vacuolata TaxID=74820 RepID=A0A0H5BH24_9EUKA|nr:mRNA splicing factor PRP17 [Lotharella vacuolata]
MKFLLSFKIPLRIAIMRYFVEYMQKLIFFYKIIKIKRYILSKYLIFMATNSNVSNQMLTSDANLINDIKKVEEKKINYLFLLSHLKGVNCFNMQSKAKSSIIAGGLDGCLKFWGKKNTFKLLCSINISKKPICDIIQSQKLGFVSVNHFDKSIITFDLKTLKIIKVFQIGKIFTVMNKNTCNTESLLLGCSDGIIYEWNLITGNLDQRYEGHIGSINSIISDYTHNILVTTGKDKKIRIWNYGIPKQIGQISRSFASHIISSSYINKLSLCIYQTSLNKIFTTIFSTRCTIMMGSVFLGHKVHGVKCKPSFYLPGYLLMSGDYYGNLHFWNLIRNSKMSKSFKAHHSVLIQIKNITNMNQFITASWDGFIKYWAKFNNEPII